MAPPAAAIVDTGAYRSLARVQDRRGSTRDHANGAQTLTHTAREHVHYDIGRWRAVRGV